MGGINVGAAKVDKAANTSETQTRQFDPQWINPLRFLDDASRRNMIVRDVDRVAIGQIALFSGKMAVFDLSLFKSIWGTENFIEKAMAGTLGAQQQSAGNRQSRRANKSNPPGPTDEQRLARNLIPNLPHVVQGTIYDDSHNFWFVLKDDCLTVSASDLLLRHGVSIAGKWNIVGVIDARPLSGTDEDSVESAIDHIIASSKFGMLGEAIRDLTIPIRQMLGRPTDAFGITPLLIFREVSG